MSTLSAKRRLKMFERLKMTEKVVYVPAGGEGREISALVERITESTGYGQAAAPVVRVTVLNDPADGIAAAELDVGGDSLMLPERMGMENTRREIHRLSSHDEEILILEVR